MGSARCLSPSRPAWAWCPSREEAWEAPAHQADWVWWTGPGCWLDLLDCICL